MAYLQTYKEEEHCLPPSPPLPPPLLPRGKERRVERRRGGGEGIQIMSSLYLSLSYSASEDGTQEIRGEGEILARSAATSFYGDFFKDTARILRGSFI